MPELFPTSPVAKTAVLSDCGRYRYELTRTWDRIGGFEDPSVCVPDLCAFVMLNPSTADAEKDDPTIRRCIGFAKRWGYDGVAVLNLFAYRATKPADMKAAADPVGPENDDWLSQTLDYGHVIAAWGKHGAYRDRDREVMRILSYRRVHCLGTTKDGHPRHPLYVRGDAEPVPFEGLPVVDESEDA